MLVPFELPPGINSDDTAFARPGTWQDGSNVRFRFGRPETIGGWSDMLSGSALTGVCRNALAWIVSAGLGYIAFGTHSKLQVLADNTLYDITPAGLVTGAVDSSGSGSGWGSGTWGSGTWGSPASIWYARTWSFATWGDYLIANPRGGTLYEWQNDTGVAAAAITNAPAVVTCCLVTPERQLLALGCNEEVSGNFNHLCIRGSDIEDNTSWTTLSTNNVFEHILPGEGRIVAARLFGSFVAVWTTEAVYLGQFLGNPGETYRFDLVAMNCGLAGANSLVVADQTAFWLGSDYQFRVWQLGGVPQILPCPALKDFKDHLDTSQIDKVAGAGITSFGEAWFFYPDTRDGSEASRYIAYDYGSGTPIPVWFKGVLARTQASDAGATAYPFMSDVDGGAFFHEYGSTADGANLDWFIESADTYVDEGRRNLLIRGIIPDFENQGGDITLTLYAKQYPQSTATTLGPWTLTASAEKKDFMTSGRLLAAKFAGTAYARFGKPMFDAVPRGQQ